MRPRVGKKRLNRVTAQSVVGRRHCLVQVEQRRLFRSGHLSCPHHRAVGRPADPRTVGLPHLPRHLRAEVGRRPLGPGVGEILPQIRAVGPHRLGLLRQEVVDLLSLVACSANRPAGPGVIIDRAAVVVAELDDHRIARLHHRERRCPAAFGDERPAAPPADGDVHDVHLRGVEVLPTFLPPAALAGSPALYGRVANQEERGQLGTRRTGHAEPSGIFNGPVVFGGADGRHGGNREANKKTAKEHASHLPSGTARTSKELGGIATASTGSGFSGSNGVTSAASSAASSGTPVRMASTTQRAIS